MTFSTGLCKSEHMYMPTSATQILQHWAANEYAHSSVCTHTPGWANSLILASLLEHTLSCYRTVFPLLSCPSLPFIHPYAAGYTRHLTYLGGLHHLKKSLGVDMSRNRDCHWTKIMPLPSCMSFSFSTGVCVSRTKTSLLLSKDNGYALACLNHLSLKKAILINHNSTHGSSNNV